MLYSVKRYMMSEWNHHKDDNHHKHDHHHTYDHHHKEDRHHAYHHLPPPGAPLWQCGLSADITTCLTVLKIIIIVILYPLSGISTFQSNFYVTQVYHRLDGVSQYMVSKCPAKRWKKYASLLGKDLCTVQIQTLVFRNGFKKGNTRWNRKIATK